jgi:plastocyanin
MKAFKKNRVALALAFFISVNVIAGDFNASNVATSAWNINGSQNPTLTLQRGLTYSFAVSVSGHPFDIKTNSSTTSANRYTNGITGQGAQNGALTFKVPTNAPNTLTYNCEIHPGMTGTINIIDTQPVTATNAAIISNNFIFQIFTTANHTNFIQASTNLATTNWIFLGTNLPTAGSFNFTDSVANSSNRFYRVVEP